MNGFGKCASAIGGWGMEQLDCDRKKDESESDRKKMLWSWNETSLGSMDKHLCNYYHRCVACDKFAAEGTPSQKFNFVDSKTHPGFYSIMNEHSGKCLAVKGNTNEFGAEIWVDNCKSSDAGQRWKWYRK